MLSDAEQRRLTQIELELWTEDPRFVARFHHRSQRGPNKWGGMTARVWLLVAALTMGLAVLMASAGMVAIALCAAAVSAGLWLTDPSRSQDR